MDLLQTLLVYMSLVFATSVQTAPEPSMIPDTPDFTAGYIEITPVPTAVPTPVPTINITPNPAYKTLQVGERGNDVRGLQEKLMEYGYYTGEIDGAYGNQTRQAVEHFQYMHGLTVDGIAGRHTQTVLYESSEIRLPEGGKMPTEPSATTQLAPAITPAPSANVVEFPVLTATPSPAVTPVPTAEPMPVVGLAGCSVTVDGLEKMMKVYQQGEVIYLPVLQLMKETGINVISSSSVELEEYAFAIGMDLMRFTHTENQQGEPIDLQVYRNAEPQLVPNRTLYQADQVLYMPAESIASMTGFSCVFDSEKQQVVIQTFAE